MKPSFVLPFLLSIALVATPGSPGWAVDTDGDGLDDSIDNCIGVANPDQRDEDLDLIGTACDADLDNDGFVGSSDFFGRFRVCLGENVAQSPQCAAADFDGDGVVASSDFFSVLRPSMGEAPGPTGLTVDPVKAHSTEVPEIEVILDDVLYAPRDDIGVSIDLGERDVNLPTLEAVLVSPDSRDIEPVTLNRVGGNVYSVSGAVSIRPFSGRFTVGDGVLRVPRGRPFFAMFYPDETEIPDLSAAVYSDLGLLEGAGSTTPPVEPALALSDDEGKPSPRPAGTLIRRGERPVQIALDEVLLWMRDSQELNDFLALSGGTLVETQVLEDAPKGRASFEKVALIRVPVSPNARHLAMLDALLGEEEELVVSRSEVLDLLAQVLLWRFDGWTVSVNPRLQYFGAPSVSETTLTHTMELRGASGDGSTCIPGDPAAPCPRNVPALWAFNELFDFDTRRIDTAVLDMGFAPNGDFRAPSLECDMSVSPPFCGAGASLGSPTVGNSFFGDRSWHGTGVFTTLGGLINNVGTTDEARGGAGVGGQSAVPMLLKYDLAGYVFDIGTGIRLATDSGASCINVSGGYPCNILTNVGPDFDICTPGGRLGICAVVAAAEIAAAATICAATSFLPGIGSIACAVANGAAAAATSACVSTLAFGNLASPMASAAAHAHRNGVPVVVSAGNALNPEKLPPVIRDLVNLSNRSSDAWGVVPAIFPTTISVGAVGSNLENEHFFGSSVDVWAPIRSTYFAPTNVDDPSSPLVQDDIGGTSGAAPYVAGVIASMQAANRDLDPQNPLLSDAQKRTIVERIRSLLRSNAFTNGQLVALGYPDEPTERPRLVNPLGSVQAAAGAAILGLPALGFDATLGFGELSEPDDTPAQARVLFPGVTRTGTVLTLDRTGATSPPQDQDWYTFSMPDGRPHEAFVSLITPASVDTDPVFPQGGGLTRFSSSTYRVVADASAQVDFAVTSNPGLDNVYKVTLQGVPRPALPDLRVIRPVGSSVQVCANEPITFEATASFPGFPGVVVGSRDVRWFFDGSGADPHFSAVARFAPGSHTAFVEAYGDGRTRQTISIQARLCTSGVPTGEIITPAGSSASFFWDGFDTSRGQWFYDLSVRGFASDPEDGLLTGTSLEWKTDRTDLQGELLGTGTNPTLRLYGDQCFGEDHRIRLEAEDSDSQRETLEEVVIRLSTLC